MLPFIVILPALVYSLISLVCAAKYFKSLPKQVGASPHPGVSILKPVKGMDAGSYDNFASFCRQNHAGALQLIFA
ncbi:MAG: ceramide glucosyltransferase, partial [Pseudomonadota bacterium]